MRNKFILFVSVVLFFAIAHGADEPSFVKNQPIDISLADLNKRYENPNYKNAFGPAPEGCSTDTLKSCKKDGLKCKCYRAPLASSNVFVEDLRATILENKVVEFSHSINGQAQYIQAKAPTPAEEFGDAAPDQVLEGDRLTQGGSRYQVFVMYWKLAKGEASAKVMCPVKKYAGAEVIDPLRTCPMFGMSISRIREFQRPKLKISTQKY